MLEICYSTPIKIIPDLLKGLSKEEKHKKMSENLVKTGDNKLDSIFLHLKPTTSSISVLEPRQTISTFSYILSTSIEQAKKLYKEGARSLNELLDNKYDLTTPQIIGCKYYQDLLTDNETKEINIWATICMNALQDLKCNIFRSSVNGKKINGIHSCIEISICLSNDIVDEHMRKFMENISDCIEYNPSDIYLPEKTNADRSYNRIGCIGNLHKKFNDESKYGILKSKITLIDITFYNTRFYPLPLLRNEIDEWSKNGLILDDQGIKIKDLENSDYINWRSVIGYDNPDSLEECLKIIKVLEDNISK